jgi:putative membrane-bound dehydrogenase-like protein
MALSPDGSKASTRWFATVLGLVALTTSLAPVQAEEKEKNDFDNWKHMDVPPAPALSADEQMMTFKIAPGFKFELAAAEPEIVDPVAIRWDPKGRMWAVEMRGYMPNVEGEGEQKPVGEIAVLEDANGDGYFEKRTTFLDGLVMPRALALVEGGVLVAEPPHLWYCRDTDGDLKCDEKTEVINYAKQGPVEHTENSLRQAIDNWIYNAKSNRRFRFELKDGEPTVTVDKTRFRGQWGIAQDSFGRLYYNNNWHYLTGETYADAERYADPPEPKDRKPENTRLADGLTDNHSVPSDHAVHSIRVNPGVNRGYRPGLLRDDGRLSRATAVSGQTIYRGDQFPGSFGEDAFIPEPGGNVVTYFDISWETGKPKGEHITFDDPKWGQREFFASRDERFRPVEVEDGPDGALYVVDLYRGILQHKVYITDKYLKKQILARELDEPVGLGRIWRIVSTDQDRREQIPDLTKKSDDELVALLSHNNGWHRDWAQRLLIRREAKGVAGKLRKLALNGDAPVARVHAIWTLEGLGALDKATARKARADSHRQVRIAAARAWAQKN